MGWKTLKDDRRIKLQGEFIVKVNDEEKDRCSNLEEAEKLANQLGGEVWCQGKLLYSSITESNNLEESEPESDRVHVLRTYLLTPKKAKLKKV